MKLSIRNLQALGMAILALVVGAGCGETDDGKSAEVAKPIAQADLFPALIQGVCENVGPCCVAAKLPVDAAACKTALTADLSTPKFSSATTKYDAQAAGECLKAYLAAVKSCALNDSPPICEKIWTGLLAPGQGCTDDEECASVGARNATCSFNGVSLTGVCTLAPVEVRGVAGASCTCTAWDNSGSCTASAAAGPMPTDSVTTCYKKDGLFCDSNNGVQPATCKPLAAVGDPCSYDSCVENATCGFQSGAGICELLKPDGAACGDSDECLSQRCDGNSRKCSVDTFANPEVCSGQIAN